MKASLFAAVAALSIAGVTAGHADTSVGRTRHALVPMPPQKPLMLAENGAGSGAAAGAATGAVGGAVVGGPIGAAAGAAAGAVGGAIVGGLSDDDRHYVHTYVEERHRPDVRYDRQVVVGEELPDRIEVYRFEDRPSMRRYRYAELNGHTVLINADTRRIVDILD